jgi:hypothetical protein
MAPSTFRQTVAEVAARAKERLPEAVNGRIEGAVKLVLSHDVVRLDDGTIEVGSSTDPMKVYTLTGQACTCKDFTDGKAPEGWCCHRIAAGIAKRVQELLPPEPELGGISTTDATPRPEAPVAVPHGIDPRHIVLIQGRPFVKFAGLLDLAHQRGLQSLKVDWTANTDELSLAHAVAVFPFGTFEESGDATPSNVNKKVAPHFRRCALTRAAARALRDALNCDMVTLEELADE